MPTHEEYEKTLENLTKLLKRKAMSARAIADAQKCCKPAAYQRVRALQSRGVKVEESMGREAVSGPLSVLYSIPR